MTLEKLRKLVESFSKRTDLRENDFLDQAIELAAIRIGRDVRMMELDRIAMLDVVNSAGLPDGYQFMSSVTANVANREIVLISVSSDQFSEVHQSINTYTVKNGQIHINGTARVTINYSVRPEELVNDADSNFVLTNAPDLYLFATLMEVWTSLLDAEAFEHARSRYEDGVAKAGITYERQTFGSNKRIARVDL